MSYPLHVQLRNKRVVVVGAGAVGTRRIRDLIEAEAEVTVIAPEATDDVKRWVLDDVITWWPRSYQQGDLDGAWLVHIATRDVAVNTAVAQEAHDARIWAIRADDHAASDAHRPAAGTVDGVTLGITAGDPRRSVELRDAFVNLVANGDLGGRRRRESSSGSVVLIGGGPGDADLITVRGRRALLAADVVVYDRLAPLDLLAELSSDVELVNAGKEPHRHALTQDEINAVIVERALAGKRVARLKGGDPYVLGRGSEEVLACVAAGVPVEVVPGITSAIAAPSAAGIPVTHRGLTTGFVVISGHEIADLESVVKSGLTVVVLMGVATLPELVAQFEIHGASASLPVAIIEKAFSHEQRTLRSTLVDVVHDAERVGVSNPAVIVIGEVAALGAELPLQLASSR